MLSYLGSRGEGAYRGAGLFHHLLRGEDMLARYGGKEFVLLLSSADGETARQIINTGCAKRARSSRCRGFRRR